MQLGFLGNDISASRSVRPAVEATRGDPAAEVTRSRHTGIFRTAKLTLPANGKNECTRLRISRIQLLIGAMHTRLRQAESQSNRQIRFGERLTFHYAISVLAISRHSFAHWSHASAQRRQCSLSCFRHSLAQASQALAQRRHRSPISFDPWLTKAMVIQQSCAHSRSRRMQSAIWAASGSLMQALKQRSHSCMQRAHSSMQDWWCW